MSFLLSPMRRTTPSSLNAVTRRVFSATSAPQVARMTLVGRIGTDPELNTSSKGNDFIKYVVGTPYGPKENRQTSWFRVTCFANEGSPLRDLTLGLTKGTLIYLEGDAAMTKYEDPDGRLKNSLSLIQTKVEVLKRPYRDPSAQSGEASDASDATV